MSRRGYHIYLQTEHWQKLSQKKRRECQNCVVCGERENLCVHHQRYSDTMGSTHFREKDNDLLVLCGKCHSAWHHSSRKICMTNKDIKRLRDVVNNHATIGVVNP